MDNQAPRKVPRHNHHQGRHRLHSAPRYYKIKIDLYVYEVNTFGEEKKAHKECNAKGICICHTPHQHCVSNKDEMLKANSL